MTRVPLLACLASLLVGCGDPAADGGCPSNLPASCPAPAQIPSYRTDIAPIIQGRCLGCHGPGGVAQARHDFTTYATIHAQRSAILNQVYSCLMPPAPAPPPTADERRLLLAWLVCMAPDN